MSVIIEGCRESLVLANATKLETGLLKYDGVYYPALIVHGDDPSDITVYKLEESDKE